MVEDGLVSMAQREKCLNKGVRKMIGNGEDDELWSTMVTCYERPKKYIAEALRPINEFRKYKMSDRAAVREVCS